MEPAWIKHVLVVKVPGCRFHKICFCEVLHVKNLWLGNRTNILFVQTRWLTVATGCFPERVVGFLVSTLFFCPSFIHQVTQNKSQDNPIKGRGVPHRSDGAASRGASDVSPVEVSTDGTRNKHDQGHLIFFDPLLHRSFRGLHD